MTNYRKELDRLLSEYQHAARTVKDECRNLETADGEVEAAGEAQQVLQHVAQTVQQQAHEKIASVVTRCLEAVFDDPYEFQVVFERKRGRTEATLVFSRDGEPIRDPLGAVGGGVVAVAAFALRLACLVLTRPPVRRLVVLDEPFAHVHSPVYRERVKVLLETLARDMDVQFIIVTGIEDLKTGLVVEL